MFGRHLVRRAVGLLGAVAVTGVLSAGVLGVSPASADTQSSGLKVPYAASSLPASLSGFSWSGDFSWRLANGLGSCYRVSGANGL